MLAIISLAEKSEAAPEEYQYLLLAISMLARVAHTTMVDVELSRPG